MFACPQNGGNFSFDRLEERLVPLLREAGVDVFDNALTVELVKELIGKR